MTVPPLRVTLPPFAMQTAFPSSDYYEGSAPSDVNSRRRACPKPAWPDSTRATPDGSHVHSLPGRRVRCPTMPLRPRHAYAAVLRRGLPTSDMPPAREFPTNSGCAPLPSPDPPGSSWWADLSGLRTLVPLVHLLVSLAGPASSDGADTSRRCQGCLPPSPASPRSGCPQLSCGCCDSPTEEVSHLLPVKQRLVALHVGRPDPVPLLGTPSACYWCSPTGTAIGSS